MKRGFIMLLLIGAMIVIGLSFTSCNENARTKSWGGSSTLKLEPGQHFVNATWKDANLWIVTRDRREGEMIDSYKFFEKSNWGMAEGVYTIIEQ